jgi:hypothetical protein
MNCPKCDTHVNDEATFCPKCGFKLTGDGQVLSTNAIHSIQEKSISLYQRVTYSVLTKILFFTTLLAIIGAIIAMFSQSIGAYFFIPPALIMFTVLSYRTIVLFVDVNHFSNEELAQELRILLTFFTYCLFLGGISVLVVGVTTLTGSWRAGEVIMLFWGSVSLYSSIALYSIFLIWLLSLIPSLKKQ